MNCSFCGKEIPKGTGKIYVTKEGNASFFCSSKCEKNTLKLHRHKEKTKWTQAYHKEKKARHAVSQKKSKQ